MIDVYIDDMKLKTINHKPEGQQLVFKDKNDNCIAILLSLPDFESLYNSVVARAETLDSFEPSKNGRYKLKP